MKATRLVIFSLLAMLFTALHAGCQQPQVPAPSAQAARDQPREAVPEDEDARIEAACRRIEVKLEQPVPVDFEQVKLVNVLDYLRNTTGISFLIDWAALEKAGVEQDVLITLKLQSPSAAKTLQLVLQQASTGSEEPIGYFVDLAPSEGADKAAVIISTMKELKKNTDTRVYDIADLLEWGAEPESVHLLIGVAGKTTIESMQYAKRGPAGKASVVPPVDARVELLLDLLPSTIGNQSDWAMYGGEVCSLRELNGNLIIQAPRPWHRQIEQLLADLREARVLSLASLMRHREVLALLRQAEAHRFEQQYDEAMVYVNKALRVDANHPYALGIKEVIEKTRERRKGVPR